MGTPALNSQVITQIGFVVYDVEQTAAAYAEFFGVPMPEIHVTEAEDVAHTEYLETATPARARQAFIAAGSVVIELIEPDEEPSTWREFLDIHGEGVHHIAFAIEGMDQAILELKGRGMPLIQRGNYTGGRYAYVDTLPQLKVLVELLEHDRS